MLLIVTERGDLTADWLILELEDRGARFLRFNTEDYPTDVGLVWRPEGAALRIRGRVYPLSEFSAVWYRRPVSPRLPDAYSSEQAEWALRESWEALMGAWRTLDALWINHPDRNRLAESKPEQLVTAARLGFEVPESLVTNEPDELRAFLAKHQRGIVCKPLWNGRVPVDEDERLFFTSPCNVAAVSHHPLGAEPYLFQEHVRKRADLRVTVVGCEAFTVRIESQKETDTKTDWRKGKPGRLDHVPDDLPTELAELCVGLCEHYGLHFGAIDLARRPDGGYTFFELNPNGQWAWVEQRTGLPLRARLADRLLAAGA